jgi:2-polyprenyl-3-methyl-5-hydroxy-6-metoxy-1,4-benzoquinol methylase
MPKPTNFSYEGKDLETMSLAEKYHQWILDIFRPHLGKNFVEVGAGSGSFSTMVAAMEPDSLALVEPSPEMYSLLIEEAERLKKKLRVTTHNDFLTNVAKDIKKHKPDSILYVNVLEHVPDDVAELKAVYDLLPPGGRVFVFVPALKVLMSDFDRQIGHFRRYSKADLVGKAKGAGFTIIKAQYFDFFGIAPWWVNFVLLRTKVMKPGAARLYDRLVVPFARVIEGAVTPLVGKNVLMIAEKPSNGRIR